MNISWNAEKYTKDFAFVYQYGDDVAQLLDCAKGGLVVDLGCGNGALTSRIKDMGYEVIGLDSSDELLAVARGSRPDIEFIKADAADFSLEKPADAVFSNAVLHWIDRHRQPDVLKCVHKALKDGGQFVLEFGGQGNNALIHTYLEKTFTEYGYRYEMPFYFPTIGEYASLAEAAGFTVRYAVLFDRPTPLKGKDGLAEWIKMFVKTPFSVVQDKNAAEEIINKTVDRLRPYLYKDGVFYADYVRLRMKLLKERA